MELVVRKYTFYLRNQNPKREVSIRKVGKKVGISIDHLSRKSNFIGQWEKSRNQSTWLSTLRVIEGSAGDGGGDSVGEGVEGQERKLTRT